jgi:hypothetical protein
MFLPSIHVFLPFFTIFSKSNIGRYVWDTAMFMPGCSVFIPGNSLGFLFLPQAFVLVWIFGVSIQLMGCFEIYPSTCWGFFVKHEFWI